jgi:hypothetical protein
LVLSAIVCGAIYMVVSPAPAIKRAGNEPQSRTLAYQEKIARTADDVKEQQAAAPEAPAPAQSAPAEETQPAPAPEAGDRPPAAEQSGSEMAALPPSEESGDSDPNALPWQQAEPPNPVGARGMDEAAPDPMAEPPGAYGDRSGPMAALPEEEMDPNAWPGGPDEDPQEWVQVLVSGAGMHGTASDEAPMLFAFPSGRVLRVVSRYEGWVEVTDPQSAATGWMQAQYLAPVAAPGTPYDSEAMYEEEDPRWRRGWLRRNGGGFVDMLNRALGGF